MFLLYTQWSYDARCALCINATISCLYTVLFHIVKMCFISVCRFCIAFYA
ncbi:unnamed protein product [Ixodes pacificus]